MAANRRASLAMCFWLLLACLLPAAARAAGERIGDLATAAQPASGLMASDKAGALAAWVRQTDDNLGLPFVIVDKQLAALHVFSPAGGLIGETSVLLGLSVGDAAIPGIASRTPGSLAPAERTTPAGRFASEPGHNAQGEDIVWFDYEASLAIHRLRPSPAGQRRDERMASASSEDKRISYGCIVVPVPFYEAVVRPVLGRHRGVVYVLPETRPWPELFGGDHLSALAR